MKILIQTDELETFRKEAAGFNLPNFRPGEIMYNDNGQPVFQLINQIGKNDCLIQTWRRYANA